MDCSLNDLIDGVIAGLDAGDPGKAGNAACLSGMPGTSPAHDGRKFGGQLWCRARTSRTVSTSLSSGTLRLRVGLLCEMLVAALFELGELRAEDQVLDLHLAASPSRRDPG